MKPTLFVPFALLAPFALCALLFAKPSLEIPLVSKSARALYEIHRFTLTSEQGIAYPIQVALPKATKKPAYALYTLDGNAFFPALLDSVAINPPSSLPLVVGIGHSGKLAFDRAQRERDYVREQGAFLRFILQNLKPTIARRYGAMEREELLGHSFGGLFVLYALAHAPQSFSVYVCASPSLWLGDFSALFSRIEQNLAGGKNLGQEGLDSENFAHAGGRADSKNLVREQGLDSQPLTHAEKGMRDSKKLARLEGKMDSENLERAEEGRAFQKLAREKRADLQTRIIFTRGGLESSALDERVQGLLVRFPSRVKLKVFVNQSHGSSIPYALQAGIESLH